ncbi:MAG: type I-F CRISPR-associated endoribonuclease Cas6/Csy4 [Thermodesulfobacteriota bacterium]
MMKYYQEISLLHRADIGLYDFWQKLYQQIHLALVECKGESDKSTIGVSFPEYDATHFMLGCRLRLFAPEKSALEQLQCEKWLSRLKDYLHCGEIEPVPETIAEHACFCQVKPKGSKEKLAKRWAKRHGEEFEKALTYYDAYEEERSRLPYINMGSLTNGCHFRLFIEKREKETAQAGVFSCYGLSPTTTVPLF